MLSSELTRNHREGGRQGGRDEHVDWRRERRREREREEEEAAAAYSVRLQQTGDEALFSAGAY